jgi:Icc-related predicted phosphoesterase
VSALTSRETVKLLFTSDLHGLESAYRGFAARLASGDYACGVIAGDLMTHFSPDETEALLAARGLSADDLLPELDSPSDTVTHESNLDSIYAEAIRDKARDLQGMLERAGVPVYFVMGNDDGIVAGGYEWSSTSLLVNVNQRRVDLRGWNIVGYQYTLPFVGGLFEKPEAEQAEDLRALRELVDDRTILITHGPPRGIMDWDNYGSQSLRELVDSRHPRVHLFGHIHQAAGVAWPFINGAFPTLRAFLSIDVMSGTVEQVAPLQ